MMANAMRDPLFWAAVDVANKDYPGAGDFCLRCHTPPGWMGGRVVKTTGGGTTGPGGASGCQLTDAARIVINTKDLSQRRQNCCCMIEAFLNFRSKKH